MANWVARILVFFAVAAPSGILRAEWQVEGMPPVAPGEEPAVQYGYDSASAATSYGEPGCFDPGCDASETPDSELWTPPARDHGLSIEIGGWATGGLTINADGNTSGTGNAPYGYNNVSDGAVLNQLWVYAEKAVDTGGCGVDWGFRADYLFGVDGPDNQAFGDRSWDFGWNSARDYGSAIPQLYGEMGIDDLTVKMGYFFTIVGWEYSQSPRNFFYSRSYAFYYGEPNTHSGMLASYALNEDVTVHGGWTLGMDGTLANYLHASTFLGGVDLSIGEDTALYWAVLAGDWGDGTARGGVAGNDGNIYLNSIVLEHSLSDRWTYVLQHDLGVNWGLGADDSQWYAVVQYLTCRISTCWRVGGRLEWFRDEDGARVGGGPSDAGDYYEATLGLHFRPNPNLTFRPELRWDWFDGERLPYDDGTADDFFTFGMDAVFAY
jgi:hypothetical protein